MFGVGRGRGEGGEGRGIVKWRRTSQYIGYLIDDRSSSYCKRARDKLWMLRWTRGRKYAPSRLFSLISLSLFSNCFEFSGFGGFGNQKIGFIIKKKDTRIVVEIFLPLLNTQ